MESNVYRGQQVIVLSMLVRGKKTEAARKAKEIAERVETETEAFNVCVDGVWERRRLVGGS